MKKCYRRKVVYNDRKCNSEKVEQRKMRKLYYVYFHRSEILEVVCYCLRSAADGRLRF